jgi:hypothetical protein
MMAKAAGYTADAAGNIYSPEGKALKGGTSRTGHKNFIPNVVPRAQRSSVLWHRFIVYYFLGNAVFEHRLVRHLNDIPADNRLINLALGSYLDNRRDIPRSKLSSAARKSAHLLVARSRKLSDTQIQQMRELRVKQGISFHQLGQCFGVTTMTAYRAITKQSWRNV